VTIFEIKQARMNHCVVVVVLVEKDGDVIKFRKS